MPTITVIDSLDYTTRPLSLQHTTNGNYVTVYTPEGEYLSRHTSIEEATESIVRHASAVELTEDTAEVVYKIILPEKHVSILLRRANSTYGPGEVDVTPPSAPTAGFLSNLTANSTRVNWTNAGDNDIDYTRVYKSTVSSSTFFTLVAQVDYPTNSYTDTINPAQQVWYRVSHVDSAGNESAFSSVFTDITAPNTPSAPTVASAASTSVTLTLPATTAFDHASWRVYRSAAGGSTADTLVASGVTGSSYSVTGLSPQTSYAFAVQAVDASGNASATSATVTQQTAAEGDNAARINAILAGRSPHFSYSMPADPVTTRQETVTTAAGFNAAAAINGTRIIINSSFSGSISINANDIDVVMSNSATITGDLYLGQVASRSNRVRWTGGNLSGRLLGIHFADYLFDDFNVSMGTQYGDLTAGWTGSSNLAVNRLAFINCTLRNSGWNGANGNNWVIFLSQSPRHSDIFFGNTLVHGDGIHILRLQAVDRLSIVGCALVHNSSAAGSSLRVHAATNGLWIKDTWGNGAFHCNHINDSDNGPGFYNGLLDNFDRYAEAANTGAYAYSSKPTGVWINNTGTVQNSTLYNAGGSGTIAFPDLVNGDGNSNSTWNQTTLPDYSTVGAIR